MKNKAFTLIELLVVIVIIGILTTLSTSTFSTYNEKARDVQRLTLTKEFETNFFTYKIENSDLNINFSQIPLYQIDLAMFNIVTQTDFNYENIQDDECIWLGMNASGDHVISFLEEEKDDTMKTLSNLSPTPVVTAGTAPTAPPCPPGWICGGGILTSQSCSLPSLAGYTFRAVRQVENGSDFTTGGEHRTLRIFDGNTRFWTNGCNQITYRESPESQHSPNYISC